MKLASILDANASEKVSMMLSRDLSKVNSLLDAQVDPNVLLGLKDAAAEAFKDGEGPKAHRKRARDRDADVQRTPRRESSYGYTEANRAAFLAHLVAHEEGQRMLSEINRTPDNDERKVLLDSGAAQRTASLWQNLLDKVMQYMHSNNY
jgi:hypothetical protein